MASPSVHEALRRLSARASSSACHLRELKAQAVASLKEQQQHAPQGHTPSGPRRKGEGVHDSDQGVLTYELTPNGGACLRISLLAAGFVLGPSGSSIRDIIAATGADVRSWSEQWRAMKIRTFVVEGKQRSVVQALNIINAAVDRYNDLCGGAFNGLAVDRAQVIEGVRFFYSPPPRAAVPYAAALRTHDRPSSPPARKSLGFASPPNKENAATLGAGAGSTPRHSMHQQQHQPLLPLHLGGLQSTGSLPLGGLPSTPSAAQAHEPSMRNHGNHSMGHSMQHVQHPHESHMPQHSMGNLRMPQHGMEHSMGQQHPMGLAALPEGMVLDSPDVDMEAVTPAYRTSYSLFGCSSGLGAGATPYAQQHPFAGAHSSASTSLFASAYETPRPVSGSTHMACGGVGRSLFASMAAADGGAPSAPFLAAPPSQPLAAEPLHRQLSAGDHPSICNQLGHQISNSDDMMLAATGFPSYTSFALQQADMFQPSLFSSTPGPSSALPQPGQPTHCFRALEPAPQLSLAAATAMWQQGQQQQQEHQGMY